MKKELPNKDGWASSFAFPANFWAMLKGLPTNTRLALHDAICAFGIEGVKCKTGDPYADSLLEGIYMQMDNMKIYGQRRKRGGQMGNQNARKHWNAEGGKEGVDDLFTGVKNETNANEYKTNKNEYKTNKNEYQNECKTNTPPNSLNNSDLDKTNKTNKNEYATNIREDKISLDNTSPLTELVLSKQKEKELLEKENEPTLAPCNGGAVSNSFSSNSFSETRLEKIDDGKATPAPCNGGASLPTGLNDDAEDFSRAYNARVSAMIGGEKVATPQTSSAISHSLQTPPPPTPPAEAQRTGGFAGNVPMSEDERAEMERALKANIQTQRDAERDAMEKGEPLPPAAKGIRAVIDDSEEARRERETKRIHDLKQLIEMAETAEEQEAIRAYL